jgi:hypothetical protein
MPYSVIFALHSLIKKDFKIFETGSGGSSLFFLDRCRKLVSLEHDKKWIKKMNLLNTKVSINKSWTLIHRNLHSNSQSSSSPYLEYLDTLENSTFDLVSIDGRLRSQSLKILSIKIKSGGYILLDNSDRKEYSEGIQFLYNLNFKKTLFRGLCYGLPWDSQATLWQKD